MHLGVFFHIERFPYCGNDTIDPGGREEGLHFTCLLTGKMIPNKETACSQLLKGEMVNK